MLRNEFPESGGPPADGAQETGPDPEEPNYDETDPGYPDPPDDPTPDAGDDYSENADANSGSGKA